MIDPARQGAIQVWLTPEGAGKWARANLALSNDGDTLAVASPWEGSAATGIGGSQANTAANAGAVYMFERSGDAWIVIEAFYSAP